MKPEYTKYLMEGQNAAVRYSLSIPRNLHSGMAGDSPGNGAGSSLEYMDHREYQPGDDLRNVDWNAYARSDKLSVKIYQKEVSPHIDILLDCSRSMNLDGTQKIRASLGLVSLIAQAALNSCFSFTSWKLGESCEPIENGSSTPALWKGLEFHSVSSPELALRQRPPDLTPRGLRFLISDLLWLGEPVDTLSILSEDSAGVFVIQLLARDDAEPPEWKNVHLIDMETGAGQQMHVDRIATEKYMKRLYHHQNNWSRTCTELGAMMCTLIAEELTRDWKLDEFIRMKILEVT